MSYARLGGYEGRKDFTMWDLREKEYIFDHGWTIGKDDKIRLTKSQFNKNQYTGRSLKDPSVKTLMLPSINGCCLIFEHKHFEIV